MRESADATQQPAREIFSTNSIRQQYSPIDHWFISRERNNYISTQSNNAHAVDSYNISSRGQTEAFPSGCIDIIIAPTNKGLIYEITSGNNRYHGIPTQCLFYLPAPRGNIKITHYAEPIYVCNFAARRDAITECAGQTAADRFVDDRRSEMPVFFFAQVAFLRGWLSSILCS